MISENSISATVFSKLEKDILSGVYKQGDVISENKLATVFSVSRTPVREAIKRLEQEGLIEYTTNKSIKILSITTNDVLDVYDIRLKIEADAVIKASNNMTSEDYKNISRIVDLQEFYSQKHDAENMNGEDSNFHLEIYKLSGSPIYENILAELHKKIQRYRQVSQADKTRSAKTISEHRAILEAMRKKDVSLIIELTNNHIINAKNNIIKMENE